MHPALIVVLSSLILLESRDITGSFFSQPFVVSVFFVFMPGYDTQTVLMLAAFVQLYFISRSPSGATLFPEYPFAFFIILSVSGSNINSFFDMITVASMVIIVSELTAYAVRFKRYLFKSNFTTLFWRKRSPGLWSALLVSMIAFLIHSSIIYAFATLVNIFTGSFKYPPGLKTEHFLFVLIIPASYSAYRFIRSKNA